MRNYGGGDDGQQSTPIAQTDRARKAKWGRIKAPGQAWRQQACRSLRAAPSITKVHGEMQSQESRRSDLPSPDKKIKSGQRTKTVRLPFFAPK